MRQTNFSAPLKGVTDPQEKRRRIGHVFIEVFRDEARSIPGRGDSWLRARSIRT